MTATTGFYNTRVRSEQLRILYDQSPATLAGELLLSSFIALVVSLELPLKEVVIWWLVISSIAVADILGMVAWRRDPWAERRPGRWLSIFSTSVKTVSLAWGLAFLYLMMRVESETQLFLAVMLACSAGGALAALAPRSELLAWNLSLTLGPSVVWLFLQGHILGLAAAVMLVGLAVLLWFGGMQIGRDIQRALELRFENEELVGELEQLNVRLSEANNQLTQMSNTDGLTGVRNRRFFDLTLESEWERSCREQRDLSLLLIDVDHFKRYNDSQGHQAGDDCLRAVVDAITAGVRRPADSVARYGGEEFAVLLPETGPEGALEVAQRIRQRLHEQRLAHPGMGDGRIVTVSTGVASMQPARGGSRDELLAHADAALYRAKDNGRDRIETESFG